MAHRKDLLNQMEIALAQLFEAAEANNDGYNIDNPIFEVTVSGVEYQVQICFVANKKAWSPKGVLRLSEMVKVHA